MHAANPADRTRVVVRQLILGVDTTRSAVPASRAELERTRLNSAWNTANELVSPKVL